MSVQYIILNNFHFLHYIQVFNF